MHKPGGRAERFEEEFLIIKCGNQQHMEISKVVVLDEALKENGWNKEDLGQSVQ